MDEKHGEEQANMIAESKPTVLGSSLDKLLRIHSFFEEKHGEEAAARIIEQVPMLLTCSLERTSRLRERGRRPRPE